MKSIITAIALLFVFQMGWGQHEEFAKWDSLSRPLTQDEDYFQQQTDYVIEVSLDDVNHMLTGIVTIDYTNNSPDQLDQIYFHLWPNAYKNKQTSFAKQQLRTGSTRFNFADSKDLGGFKEIEFSVDEEPVNWAYHKEHPDIALITLNKPVKAGETIHFTIPFTLKIPRSFSRLGHVNQSYQITQWFPKPAVYDRAGWHPMPYLDMGEFYSEFGSFDVKITLPKNYVIGATGVLQNEEEKKFLEERIAFTDQVIRDSAWAKKDTFPDSSLELKTIRFKAEQVHDFAWFADKRFYVQKGEVILASGRTVDTWAMWTNEEEKLWVKGIDYINRAVKFYSELVGEYPYPHATAVLSALSAGLGMEYPMITVIGRSGSAKTLDAVITHELGHNWFYGILATNERDHPWMDEGMNSYVDHRYDLEYYTDNDLFDIPAFFKGGSDMSASQIAFQFQARRNKDQACDTQANHCSGLNYGLSAYEKPAIIFRFLENYLGQSKFDQILSGYYEKWKFKHPRPQDLRNHFESASGKDLSWFFDGLIFSNRKLDYAAISAISASSESDGVKVLVQNKGGIAAPFTISGLKEGQIVKTKWYEGIVDRKEVIFPAGEYDLLVIDEQKLSPDKDRRNNNVKLGGLFPTFEPLKFKLLIGLENRKKSTLYFLPSVTWNNYDKTMLGISFYNTTLPGNKFEFAISPQYSLVNGDVNGVAQLRYNLYPRSKSLGKISIGLGGKSYNFGYSSLHNDYLKYYRVVPSVTLELAKEPSSQIFQTFEAKSIILNEEFADFDSSTDFTIGNESSLINSISYTCENRVAVNYWKIDVGLQQEFYTDQDKNQNYLKGTLEINADYTYARRKNMSARLFVGAFLSNSLRNRSIAKGQFGLSNRGFNDYTYEEYWFGRNDNEGIWAQQIHLREGAMKYAFGEPSKSVFGHSSNFIAAVNLTTDLPFDLPLKLPLKPYVDFGYFDNSNAPSFKDKLIIDGGLSLVFLEGAFAVYFPLFQTGILKDEYSRKQEGKYLPKITWVLDLHKANPWNIIERAFSQ